jgi:hypothetical protein
LGGVVSAESQPERQSESWEPKPASGYSWPQFGPGNDAAATHSAYALVKLRPRADEVAQGLRAAMGEGYDGRFEGCIAGVAMIGAQVEKAMGALADATTPDDLRRLDSDTRGWMRLWLSGLAQLGLTPASAARLRLLDSARPSPLEAYIAEAYREESNGG